VMFGGGGERWWSFVFCSGGAVRGGRKRFGIRVNWFHGTFAEHVQNRESLLFLLSPIDIHLLKSLLLLFKWN
jgi:hypothetical protein